MRKNKVGFFVCLFVLFFAFFDILVGYDSYLFWNKIPTELNSGICVLI